mgnify:FL=1
MTAQTVTTKNNSSLAQNNRSPILRRPGRRKKIPVLPYLLILPEIIKMLLGLLFIAPLLIGILFSFQSEQELGTYPLHLLSDAPTLQNYLEVIKAVPLFSYLLNSGIVCLVLMTTMIPGEVVVITNYTTIQSLHLTNTYAGLVVTSLISGTSIFLMREGSHLRTPAYRPQRYAVGENSTVCVKRVMFWRSDGISDSWINSVI